MHSQSSEQLAVATLSSLWHCVLVMACSRDLYLRLSVPMCVVSRSVECVVGVCCVYQCAAGVCHCCRAKCAAGVCVVTTSVCCRHREEMLYQLKVVQTPPSVTGRAGDNPWILVDSEGEEVDFTFTDCLHSILVQ